MPKPYKTKVEDYVDVFGLRSPRALFAASDDVRDAVWRRIITKYPRYSHSTLNDIYSLVMTDFQNKYTIKAKFVKKVDPSFSAVVDGIDARTTIDQDGNCTVEAVFPPSYLDGVSPMEAASIVSAEFYKAFKRIKEKK